MTRKDPHAPGWRLEWLIALCVCLGLAALAGVMIDARQAVAVQERCP